MRDRRAAGTPTRFLFCGRQAGRLGGTDLPGQAGGDDPASLIS